MRLWHVAIAMTSLTLALCPARASAAAAHYRQAFHAHHHHRHGFGTARFARRAPVYAPPAPIGVGLFGTGLFYGDAIALGLPGF